MPVSIDQDRLTFFKQQFEERLCNDKKPSVSFESVVAEERRMKVDLINEVQGILEIEKDATCVGEQFYTAVMENVESVFYVSIPKIRDLEHSDTANYNRLTRIYGDALLSSQKESEVFRYTYEEIQKFHYDRIANAPGRADMIHLLFAALICKPDSKTIIGNVTFFGDVTEFFLGTRLLTAKDSNVEYSFEQLNGIVATLYDEMTNAWGWNPQDNIDVQCSLWREFKENSDSYTNYSQG